MTITKSRCARCGSAAFFFDCVRCDGEGYRFDEEDDLFWPRNGACSSCNGSGGHWACGADYEWCEEHPMHGRANVRGVLEKYEVLEGCQQ